MPKHLGEKTIFQSKLYLIKDVNLEFGGKKVTYQIIEKTDSCAVIPVTQDNKIIMIKEYAVAHDKYVFNFPGGKMEPGKDEKEIANKELQEEIGFKAGRLDKLATFLISPGYLTQKSYVFLGRDLMKSKLVGDEDEPVETFIFSFEEVEQMILKNELEEARAIAGFFLAKKFLSK